MEIFSKKCAILLETMASGFWVADEEGRLEEVNEAYCRMSGYSRAELLQMFIWDLEVQETPNTILAHIQHIQKVGNDQFESRHRRKDGTIFDVEVRITWLESDVGRSVALFWDISARKALEQALNNSEERLRLALHSARAGVWAWDLKHGTAEWSPENFDLYGLELSQRAPGFEEWKQYIYPEDRASAEKIFRMAVEPRRPERRGGNRALRPNIERRSPEYRFEFRVLHNRRGLRWLLAIGRIERDADGTPTQLSGLTIDITERKRVEEALSANERCWRDLAEAMPQLVWTADPSGNVDYYNRRHEEFSDPYPNATTPWRPVLHPEDRWRTIKAWYHAIQHGTPYEIEHRGQRADGRFRWYLTRAVPVHNTMGQIVKWYGTSTDVDARRQAEEALRTADRRKDEFLAMLAHELRNPLAPIRNAVHIMGLLDLPNPKLKWVRDVIDRQVRHLARLVDDLLDISRIVRGKINLKKERVDLIRIIQQACEASRPIIESRKHRLTAQLPSGPLSLEGDTVRLSQVFQNLLDNAAKYTPEGGDISLTLTLGYREVAISIKDNGMGIPQDLLPQVFDLFQQGERGLDRAQGGLGIGLTLVQRLVTLHGGRATATSAGPGQGATFTVYLPLPDIPTPPSISSNRQPNLLRGRLRILVIDDEIAVAETTALWLTMEGHEVRVSHSGESGLIEAFSFQPQVVLLDIGLPGIDGYTTAQRLHALPGCEKACLVAITGYGHEEAQIRSKEVGFNHHLIKPVDPAALNALLMAIVANT